MRTWHEYCFLTYRKIFPTNGTYWVFNLPIFFLFTVFFFNLNYWKLIYHVWISWPHFPFFSCALHLSNNFFEEIISMRRSEILTEMLTKRVCPKIKSSKVIYWFEDISHHVTWITIAIKIEIENRCMRIWLKWTRLLLKLLRIKFRHLEWTLMKLLRIHREITWAKKVLKQISGSLLLLLTVLRLWLVLLKMSTSLVEDNWSVRIICSRLKFGLNSCGLSGLLGSLLIYWFLLNKFNTRGSTIFAFDIIKINHIAFSMLTRVTVNISLANSIWLRSLHIYLGKII